MRPPESSKPTAIDVDIEALNADGDGIGRHGRDTIAVPFTIPGERVRVRLGRLGPRHAPAVTLVQIVRPSPHRVVPPCPHFGGTSAVPCGGCSWQHIAYAEQLRLKTKLVDRLIRSAMPDAPRARAMRPSTPLDAPWGYRHKVHFAFGPGRDGASLSMGHFARGTRAVVGVGE